MSWRKVSSCPTDLAGRSGTTGSGRRPGPGRPGERPGPCPSRRTTASSGSAASSPTVADAQVVQPLGGGRTDPPQRLAPAWGGGRPAPRRAAPPPRPGPGCLPLRSATGLAAREASLATSLERPTPTEQSSDSSSTHPGPDAVRRWPRAAPAADGRRSRRGTPRPGRSAPPAAWRTAGSRAAARSPRRSGSSARRRRPRPGRAGGPAPTAWPSGPRRPGPRRCTSHHAPGAAAADDDRLAGQLGVVQHLHRGEEGVHVDVEDGAAPASVAAPTGAPASAPQPPSRSRRNPSAKGTPARRPSSSARRRTTSPAHPPSPANWLRWHSTAATLTSIGRRDVDPDVGLERARQVGRRHLVGRPGLGEVVRQGGGRGQGVEQRPAGGAVVAVVEVVLAEEDGGRVVPEDHVGSDAAGSSRTSSPRSSASVVQLAVGRTRAPDGRRARPARPPRPVPRPAGGPARPDRPIGSVVPRPRRCRPPVDLAPVGGPAGQGATAGHVGVVGMGVDGQHHLGTASTSSAMVTRACPSRHAAPQGRRLGSVVLVRRPTSRWKSPTSSKPL